MMTREDKIKLFSVYTKSYANINNNECNNKHHSLRTDDMGDDLLWKNCL